MNIQKIDLNLLKIFIAIYEEEKLTLASDKLGLTQPALSHALRRLRDILADDLFERTPHGMLATPFAHDFYTRIKPAMAALEQSLSYKPAFDPATSDRTFNLGLNEYGLTIILPPLLQHLKRLAPYMKLHTRPTFTSDQFHDLQSGVIDLSITQADVLPLWANQEVLFRETMVGVCAANNIDVGRKVDIATFAKAHHVTLITADDRQNWIDGFLSGQDKTRVIAHYVSHFSAIGPLIQNSDRVSVLPKRIAKEILVPYGLKAFQLPFNPPPDKVLQLYHQRNQDDQANRWLREQIGCVSTFL